jgi:hypothetical protein
MTKRLCACALFASLACAVSASAQESAAVRVIGASAFGNATLTPMIGGGVTFDRDEVVQVFGEGAIEAGAPRAVRGPGPSGGLPDYGVVFLSSDLVNRVERYAMGGVRFRRPTEAPAAVFAEFGGGAARVLNQFKGEPFAFPATHLFASVGGGIFVKASETVGAEVGYRYGRITNDSLLSNMNKVYAALAIKLY